MTFLAGLASRIKIELRGPIAYGESYSCLERRRVIEEYETRILVSPLCLNDVVKTLGAGACSLVPAPSIDSEETEADCELITPEMRCVYRSCVGLLTRLAINWQDVGSEINRFESDMKSPTVGSFKQLKQTVRCLSMASDFELPMAGLCGFDGVHISLRILSDADWAEGTAMRRSQSSFFTEAGGVSLLSVSRCQEATATSSAEAAVRAATSGFSEGILIKNVLEFFGQQTTMELHVDNPAARSIIARDGVGESEHLPTEVLQMQQAESRRSTA